MIDANSPENPVETTTQSFNFKITPEQAKQIFTQGEIEPVNSQDTIELLENWLINNNKLPREVLYPSFPISKPTDTTGYLQDAFTGGDGSPCVDVCDTSPGCIHINFPQCPNMSCPDCPSLEQVIAEAEQKSQYKGEFNPTTNRCGWTQAVVMCRSYLQTIIYRKDGGGEISREQIPTKSFQSLKSRNYKPQHYKSDYCENPNDISTCNTREGDIIITASNTTSICKYEFCYTTNTGERVPAVVLIKLHCSVSASLHYSNWCGCEDNPPCSELRSFPGGLDNWSPYGPPLAPDRYESYQDKNILRWGKNGDFKTRQLS